MNDRVLHDWTLTSVSVDWESGQMTLALRGPKKDDLLIAYGVSEFYMPRQQEWGPSVSINETHGPAVQTDGLTCLEIEMQTGDIIRIVGKSFDFPKAQS